MPKSRVIVTLGVLIALLPALGFPRAWESSFQVIAGLGIALLSVWANIDKRLMLKAKAQKRQVHKRLQAEIQAEQAIEAPTESIGKEQVRLPTSERGDGGQV